MSGNGAAGPDRAAGNGDAGPGHAAGNGAAGPDRAAGNGAAGPDRVAGNGAAGLGHPAGLGHGGDPDHPVTSAAPTALALLAGVWLVVSRLVMDFRDVGIGLGVGAVWSGVTVGITVMLIALARLAAPRSDPTLSLVNAVLAGWVIASPWVFGYAQFGIGSGPGWSDLIAGAVIGGGGLSDWLNAVSGGYRRTGLGAVQLPPDRNATRLSQDIFVRYGDESGG